MSDNYLAIKRFDEGVAAYLRGDYGSSIKLFSKALKHDSKFTMAYSSRGTARLKSGHIQKAISDFNRAVRLSPNNARAYHLRGLAFERKGDAARAYRDFDRAIEIDPDLSAAYRSRDCVMDNTVADCSQIEDYEMADYLAAMRVAHLAGDYLSGNTSA
jgi:tetratricopeptide (TPR) repeat protein